MIQPQSSIQVADNTGARQIMCIRVVNGKGGQSQASLGNIILGVVKQAIPNMAIRKSEIVRAVIVRTSQGVRRSNGCTLRFDQNAAVIINKEGAPRGTRIFGPVPRELRDQKFLKIVSLASEVV